MNIAGMSTDAIREVLDGEQINTPQPVVDRQTLDANLASMAKVVSERGCALRPHFKTHRSIEIATRQIANGASGFTCATVSEAEVLAEHGFTDIFIAYPLWAEGTTGKRLRALQEKANTQIGVDSVESLECLGTATRGGPQAEVVIEIDPGFHRSGVPPSEVLRIARAAEGCDLAVSGVFAYPGQAYGGPDAVESAAKDEWTCLDEACALLASAGIAPTIVSGGSTPTATLSAEEGLTEVRPGVYVFNDRQQVELGTCHESDVALVVLTTVVSTSVPGFFVVDAGSKALSSDRLAWMDGFGVIHQAPQQIAQSLSEHHGVIRNAGSDRRPVVGEIVAVVPNHVCNVVNLFDELLVVGADGGPEKWPVLARGGPS
jgi:D-serine deaminase-like pyridoxal phosphate-dependent protein